MEEEIFKEIYSVFADAMNGNPRFDFSILQHAGGTSKSLVIPAFVIIVYVDSLSCSWQKFQSTNLYSCERRIKGIVSSGEVTYSHRYCP